jgi:translation initiation factor IF-2
LIVSQEREEIFEVGEEGMSLEQLADLLQVDPSDIVRSLFMKGIMLSMNQVRTHEWQPNGGL